MIDGRMNANYKERGKKQLQQIPWYYPDFIMEGLRKPMRNFGLDSC
jgi:hypothetical protein